MIRGGKINRRTIIRRPIRTLTTPTFPRKTAKSPPPLLKDPATDKILSVIIQTKKGVWQKGKKRFIDYFNTPPSIKTFDVSYIRDLPPIQLTMVGRKKSEISASLSYHKRAVSHLKGFVTMTDTFAEHIKSLYGINIPYIKFRNYPSWRETPAVKRPEFFYTGAIPNSLKQQLEFLAQLKAKTKMNTLFVRRKDYVNPLTHGLMHISRYDFGSEYGLLINIDKFPQAAECMPRKLLLYLMAGMKPVLHESFTESIKYCKDTGVNPLVYSTVDDIASTIGSHNFGVIDRQYYSMEARVGDLREGLRTFGF